MRQYKGVLAICFGCVCTMLAAGCTAAINDPRRNPMAEYGEAHLLAARALKAGGYEINIHTDYSLRQFSQIRYFKKTGQIHVEHLYDFLKTTQRPGFQRFVVAFDRDTGEFFLRADLRSYSNLSSLPKDEYSPSSQPVGSTPRSSACQGH